MIGLLPPHVFGDFNDQFQFRDLLWTALASTVSPRSARRTYSLSLFFKIFKPTALMWLNVASGSYLLKV
jgi:hypothetical protein